MKAWILAGLIGAVQCWGATVVAPNALESVEGDTSAIALFGGDVARTQMIYSSQHFGLFAPEGAYLVELRFRVNEGHANFSGVADIEIRMSTSSVDPNNLSADMAANVGADDKVVLSRTLLPISGTAANSSGPAAFSVSIPLPNPFLYRPSAGSLLIDAKVYGIASLNNLDWDSNPTDGVSTALGSISGSTAFTVTDTAPVTQFVFIPVPEPSTLGYLMAAALVTLAGRKYVAS